MEILSDNGEFSYPDGSKYIGSYIGIGEDRQRHGQGTYIVPDKYRFTGNWQYDKKDGFGVMMYCDGKRFEGTWQNDKMSGYFICKYGKHHYYRGSMLDGLKEGLGEYCDENNVKYSGYWHCNKLHGHGKIEYPDGSVTEGNWDHGRQILQNNNSEKDNSGKIRKSALIIGNCDYVSANKLHNCINDAESIAKRLEELDFSVTTVTDATHQQIEDSIDEFTEKANEYDVSFVYYSGHGVQRDGENYMVPVDAVVSHPSDLKYRCNSLSYLIDRLEESKCKLRIIVLDACRADPFQCVKAINAFGGLSPVQAPRGTIIAYATSPGMVASDGIGSHSPYARAFLLALGHERLDVFNFFNEVANYVSKFTFMKQMPWFTSSPCDGIFYFNSGY